MKLKLSILSALAIAILATIFFGCSSLDPATRYAKEHKEFEYPAWLKRHPFKEKQDWRIRVAENQVQAWEMKKKREAEEQAVLDKVAQIKSKIKK